MKKITLLSWGILLLSPFCSNAALVPPANDDCANATVITVNSGQACTSVTTAVFTDATISAEANACTVAGKDIWYEFTAESTAHNIELSNFSGTPQPVSMVLYEGAQCDAMTQLYCSYNNVINATGLTVGTTYKIRLYFNLSSPLLSPTFSVCVNTPPPPANNNQSECVITTVNFDFEFPQPPAPTIYPTFVNHNVVQGWRTTATDQMMEFWSAPNYENVPAYSGSQFIELNANLVSGVYQDYQTPQPTVFSYGFAHRGRQGTDTCQLMAGPPGGPYTVVAVATTGNSSWSYYTGTYTVPAGQPVTRFIFQSVSSVGGVSVGNYLDSITFSANNGILSENPVSLDCGSSNVAVSSAGIGVWVPHLDNPAVASIGNTSANNTSISGFTVSGTYRYDWVTQYCTSTLEIEFTGNVPPTPVVVNPVYCVNEEAVPLEAQTEPGNTVTWFVNGNGVDYVPMPDTSAPGTTTYHVTQTSPEGCESDFVEVTVTVNTGDTPVTTFTYPASICEGSAAVLPATATGFAAGGIYTSATGLIIDADTGEIDIAGSPVGSHSVTYTITEDIENCITGGSNTVNLTIEPLPEVAAATPSHPGCGQASGTITVSAPIGAGLTYSLNGTNFQPGTVFPNVVPGNYTVTVKNAAGCTSVSGTVTVNPAPALPAVPNVTATPPTCTVATGSVTVNSPTGAGLTYSIDGVNFQPGTVFSNYPPGNYTITVKNAVGCTASVNVTIPVAPGTPAQANATVTHPGCNSSVGAITINSPTGAGFTYSLDGGAFQPGTAFANVAPGAHTLTVKNAAGCTSVVSVTVNPAPIIPSTPGVTAVQPTCTQPFGILLVESLGTGFSYSIDGANFQYGTVFPNLTEGTYTITVQSPGGCTATATATINTAPDVPAQPVLDILQPLCDATTGTITVISPLGAGLSYSINGTDYQESPVFSGLSPGNYIVRVKNADGCIAQAAAVTIHPAPALPVPGVITGNTEVCAGGTSQLANAVTGGTWHSSDSSIATVGNAGLVTALSAGTVTISYSVTDSNGCTSVTETLFTVHPLPNPVLTDTSVCRNSITGEISPAVLDTGLSTGYSFVWTKGSTVLAETGGSITTNEPGQYSVVVTNVVTGCTDTASATVVTSSPPVAQAEVGIDFHFSQVITVSVIGGSGDYEYSLNGGPFQDEPYFSGIYEGEYTVTVRDKNGCGEEALTVNAINYPRYFSPNGDGSNDTWNISGLKNRDAKIYIFDRYGKVLSMVKPEGAGWDGLYNGANLPATDYWFILSYISADGQAKEFKSHFSLIR